MPEPDLLFYLERTINWTDAPSSRLFDPVEEPTLLWNQIRFSTRHLHELRQPLGSCLVDRAAAADMACFLTAEL